LVADRKTSLAIKLNEDKYEVNNDAKNAFLEQRIELGTYSNNKSTVLSYVTIFESLWKELELNEQITNLFVQLKDQDSIRKDFLTIAAHELRTPIQPVLGLAEILLSKKKVDTKEQEELLTIIIRNAKRLKTLTENILDVTRIESQTLNLHKEVFNIRDVITDAVIDIQSQLSKSNNIVNIQFGSREQDNEAGVAIFVEGDRTRLTQVISNLLNNAIKFTKVGTVSINLERKDDDDNNQVIVSIKDSGPGIDPNIMPILFKKFVTKSDKGTGLGLFISKSIVEAHGGRIWAHNNPDGKGATFNFSLPINE
jgi:signal transduction histidine kinase